ncbi:hypothetical protein PV684_48830 [Streptomyces sp. AK02-04a]|nr:hypothetical protein [Streptomyces sp. AK02-04a]MDX3762938.1 hypothetical protein [Streptomyces sp. AK02-04a]
MPLSAARLPALGVGLRVLREVAEGRRVRPAQRPATGVGPAEGGQARPAVGLCDRRAEREDLHQRARRGPGHRGGQAWPTSPVTPWSSPSATRTWCVGKTTTRMYRGRAGPGVAGLGRPATGCAGEADRDAGSR